MKRKTITFVITMFFLAAPMMLLSQNPPLPNGGNNPTGGNTPVGGGAPIGSGLIIMFSLALGYGTKNIYDARKRLLD